MKYAILSYKRTNFSCILSLQPYSIKLTLLCTYFEIQLLNYMFFTLLIHVSNLYLSNIIYYVVYKLIFYA